MRTLPTVVIFAILGACAGVDSDKPAVLEDGQLVRVKDVLKGDEVRVEKDGRSARVRLVGIHAFAAVLPDPQVRALSAGSESALEAQVLGEQVTIRFDEPRQDSTGRYLAYLERDGADVNRRLVEDGWAVVFTEFDFARQADYTAAEERARAAGKNLWGLKSAADLVDGLKRQWSSARLARQK